VHHYYFDPHPYFEMDVMCGDRRQELGGHCGAGACGAAARGSRWFIAGRRFTPHVKYWIKPDIENRIKNGEIKAYFNSPGGRNHAGHRRHRDAQGRETIKNDFVFAMTGYHPDFEFLEAMGIRFEGEDRLPVCNPETLESNVPGIYLAGVIVAGSRTNEIFIENGRFHGRQIA
jgi:thioredoxin reductase (NADPH)